MPYTFIPLTRAQLRREARKFRRWRAERLPAPQLDLEPRVRPVADYRDVGTEGALRARARFAEILHQPGLR